MWTNRTSPRVEANLPAVAFLKGDTKRALALRFVGIDPCVISTCSLTGDSAGRVDTRALQIVFQMDRPLSPISVGQQIDGFIPWSQASQPAPAPQPAAVEIYQRELVLRFGTERNRVIS